MTDSRRTPNDAQPPGPSIRDAPAAVRLGQAGHLALPDHGNPACSPGCSAPMPSIGPTIRKSSSTPTCISPSRWARSNTMVLIFSSFTMASAVRAAQLGNTRDGWSGCWPSRSSAALLPGRQVRRVQGQVGGRAVDRRGLSPRGPAAGRASITKPRPAVADAALRRPQAAAHGDRREIDDRPGGGRPAGHLAAVARPSRRRGDAGSARSRTTCKSSSASISP